jgi:Zn-dependent peptidase ImmA (M78 family)
MRRYAATLGVDVCSDKLPPYRQGLYSRALNLIVVDREATYRVKRCALAHELVHWSHGDDGCNTRLYLRAERRTRRETAMLLVSPSDYAIAEQIYEGDAFRIAAELDVTRQIVDNYREMVLAPMLSMQLAL